ncbi:MAG: T9SS type A sorting domain-containing protein, partial [Prevotellaceae bacterium]|nr:T9SS type A sorting domain-containing protein [Prevotellaceae bacterium]
GSGSYEAKNSVSITAVPGVSDSTFLYWSGAKDIFTSGNNADSLKASTAILMPARDLILTAHYLKKDTIPTVAPVTFTATFTTLDVASNPIAGAAITLGNSSKNTDSNGVCTFTNLPNGSYRYTITCAGYMADSGSVAIDNGNKNIKLKLSATTTTAVMAHSYLPLHAYPNPIINEELIIENEELKAGDAIEVYALNGAPVKAFVAAGKKSVVNFSALPAGTYIVKAGNRATKIVKR